jgi:hypothetical protein
MGGFMNGEELVLGHPGRIRRQRDLAL